MTMKHWRFAHENRANAAFAARHGADNGSAAFIAAVALVVLAAWAAATYLLSVPLALDEAVLLR
jgi:hypothetical protein